MYLFISYYNYLLLSVYILEFLLFLIPAFIHAFALTVPLVWNYLPSDIFMEHSFSFLKTLIKLLLGVFFPRIYWKHIMLSEHSLFFFSTALTTLYYALFLLFYSLCCSYLFPLTAEREFSEDKEVPYFFSLLNLWHLPYNLSWNRQLINACEVNEWKPLLNKSVPLLLLKK